MPGMGELMVLMMILLIAAVGLGFWIWALVDCVTKEPPQGNDRLMWILIIALAGWIGALIYVLVRRPQRIQIMGR
jgi:hypothetical protein